MLQLAYTVLLSAPFVCRTKAPARPTRWLMGPRRARPRIRDPRFALVNHTARQMTLLQPCGWKPS
jgi:hypothetical protein